jgi:hypothetical protein
MEGVKMVSEEVAKSWIAAMEADIPRLSRG